MVTKVETADRDELIQRIGTLSHEEPSQGQRGLFAPEIVTTGLSEERQAALAEINRAIDFAAEAHGEQRRASGEPFVIHPLQVAGILADLQMDLPTIVAGLLHDVLEDTEITFAELEAEFGETVARLVDGVTKLRRVKRKSKVDTEDLDEAQAENLRKMFLAMVDDIRVVIIKLADRLHNMRTLEYLPAEKQVRMARETLDVFAPLANRLGIWQLKWQLEDLSFRHLDREHYREIAELLAARRGERAAYLERVIAILRQRLRREGLHARITGRPKHIYSIYTKMQEKDRDFSEIYDVHGVRIITQEVRECYHALGTVHSLWTPIPGEFDDYIAIPKDNGYQSLHTAVIALDGRPLEVQIRTEEMHRIAEYGIAAHWRYKEGAEHDGVIESRINWLRQASDWREEVDDPQQFRDSLDSDILSERVYVFTPKGDIMDLPKGATPVDLAYQIHSEIGHRCRGAKVDGRLVSLDYALRSGQQVEIITAKQGGPSRDWLNPHLNYVATQKARQKIRQWFRRLEREQNVAEGREILERELHRLGLDVGSFSEIAALFKYTRVEDFLAAVGYGEISPSQIANKIDESTTKSEVLKLKAIPESAASDVHVLGVGDLLTRIASCCKPVPGDKIVGYITRGKGITVHRTDCPNVIHMADTERLIPVSWGRVQQEYPVIVHVESFDRPGLLRDLAGVVADLGLNMSSVNVSTSRDQTASVVLTVGVRSVGQLGQLLNSLQGVRDVLDVHRERSA
ncbi:MAG: bifunctional (p)ppGpp synthetase/guanosine-3',5'-bis(diphosphate) 3'-pyrophosphohydrolase [Anaerolineae bacterium]|nr:bifunctional (p)ppGpp synthetase/guanosine-3',5'-bis(diphosphate) 3'-pyrophosphohydrolase [Anaerolineae bacterium]